MRGHNRDFSGKATFSICPIITEPKFHGNHHFVFLMLILEKLSKDIRINIS